MSEKRRKFDQEFREGPVWIVRETGKPIAQVARDLRIDGGALGNWVATTPLNAKVHKGFQPVTLSS